MPPAANDLTPPNVQAHRLGDAVLLGSVFRADSKSGDLPWMCGMSFGYAIIFGSVIFVAAEVEVGGAMVTGLIWLAGIVLVGVASASLSKCQSTTGSGPPDEECTHRLKSLCADLALAMIFACDAMFTMAKSRDSSFVAADNTWAAMVRAHHLAAHLTFRLLACLPHTPRTHHSRPMR